MSKIMQDPLLSFSRALLIFLIGIFIFSIVMVGIGMGALLTIGRVEVMAELEMVGAPDFAYWVILGAMLMIAGLLFLGIRFMMELRGIVLSVKDGDPFQEQNASRLFRMGWLTIGGYALSVPIGIAATYLVQFADDAEGANDVDVGFGGGGILLILTLFILARVFRTGTQMRDDLEGTV